ncbi:MAG: NUDIX hydrolase [Candidatus Micrarchaeota archaeon]|nr:NUDIX hydrolase [Candidatus Micrarchaeota archaeon]MDE1859904.1 NUDIX hydrolase [Candidatus Micrarchaeota archaeon]
MSDHEIKEYAIVLLENEHGEFLFLRRTLESGDIRESKGKWVPPGGHIEKRGVGLERERELYDLDPIKAAIMAGIRETLEECKIDISLYQIKYVCAFQNPTPWGPKKAHVLHVKLPEGADPEIKLSDGQPEVEHDRHGWFSRQFVISQIRGDRQLLRDFSESPRGRYDYTQITWELIDRDLIPRTGPVRNRGKVHVK